MTSKEMRELASAIVTLRGVATDEQAVSAKVLYPMWEDLVARSFVAEESGYRFRYGSDLYKTIQANLTFAEQWVPGVGTESLYARIDETHAGTLADPIPYDGNMELFNGKYYSQNGVVYLCNRDTGAPVYNALADLVNIYVVVAQ